MKRRSRTQRGISAAGAALLSAFLIAGCGEEEPVAGSGAEPARSDAPDAQASALPEQTANEPRGPRILRISDEGNPLIWVRPDERVDVLDAPDGEVVKTVDSRTEFDSRTVFAVQRVKGDWAGVPTAFTPNGQLSWVHLDAAKLRAGFTRYAVRVDLSDRVATFSRGDRVLNSFAVSIGMPGAETPTGTFAVTDTFRGDLNSAYGCCAVALTARQTRLPSGWLGGDRIAIHGTYGALGQAISHGCVRAADPDVSDLVDRAHLGTPVTIVQ